MIMFGANIVFGSPVAVHLNSDGEIIPEEDHNFFYIPDQKDLYFYIKMPLCVDGLKNVLLVSSFSDRSTPNFG